MAEQDIPPPTIITMKIPIIRKGEYDIWSMRIRQYICHTDHNLWDVIVLLPPPSPPPKGDLENNRRTSAPPAPKTAKQLAAKRNQERVKSILLLAIPDEYLLKFHNVADAKSLWEAIKIKKFLRSLPPSWNQIALIMRNKPDIDEIDIDDLYNNRRVYEDEMKRSSSSTSTSQNLAVLSSENTSSTNEVSTSSGDFGVRIYQKSQENRQKRAITDTRNGRVQESQRFKAKVKESQLQSTMGQQKVNYVKSRALIDHLSIKATWLWKKAQGEVGFTLGSLSEVAQAVTSRMTAWQSLSVHT
ncbi:hypothetical protein Tco_0392953 [Tanacetum coccineum]